MKKLSIIFLSTFLALSPLFCISEITYAYEDDGWSIVNDDKKFVAAIKAWNEAHNTKSVFASSLTGNGLIGLKVKFNYEAWKLQAKILGIDLDALQENLKYKVDSNGQLQFLYNGSIISQLNNIYAAVLNNYGIEENDTKIVYSGEYFQDDNGHGAFVYYIEGTAVTSAYKDQITAWGTKYLYDDEDLGTLSSGSHQYTLTKNGNNFNYYINKFNYNNNDYITLTDRSNTTTRENFIYNSYYSEQFGSLIIVRGNSGNGNPYIGTFYRCKLNNSSTVQYQIRRVINLGIVESNSSSVSIAQGAITDAGIQAAKTAAINVGEQGAENVDDAIDNYILDDETTSPIVDPDVQDNNPNYPSNPDTPSGSLNTGLSQDANGNFNFSMPDLNINWSIDSPVINIFPFSIPFDLYRAYQKLNIEGVAPHYTGTIDLIVYEWNVDFDLSQFDDFAADIRKWILFFYVIGLIIATRSIMHIY